MLEKKADPVSKMINRCIIVVCFLAAAQTHMVTPASMQNWFRVVSDDFILYYRNRRLLSFYLHY